MCKAHTFIVLKQIRSLGGGIIVNDKWTVFIMSAYAPTNPAQNREEADTHRQNIKNFVNAAEGESCHIIGSDNNATIDDHLDRRRENGNLYPPDESMLQFTLSSSLVDSFRAKYPIFSLIGVTLQIQTQILCTPLCPD
jgi:hypothetical protein